MFRVLDLSRRFRRNMHAQLLRGVADFSCGDGLRRGCGFGRPEIQQGPQIQVNFFMSLPRPTLMAMLESTGALPDGTWDVIQRVTIDDPAKTVRRVGDRLEVRAKPIAPVSHGVDIVGYIARPGYMLPRQRVADEFQRRLDQIEVEWRSSQVPHGVKLGMPGLGSVPGPVRYRRLDQNRYEAVRTLWASNEGQLGKSASRRVRDRLWREHPASSRLLRRDQDGVRRPFLLPRPNPTFRAQIARLEIGTTPEGADRRAVLLVQVGRIAEIPDGGACFGLRARLNRRRRCWGMPWRCAHRLVERILRAGHSVAVWCWNGPRSRKTQNGANWPIC